MNDWILLILSLTISGSLLTLLIFLLNPVWKKRLSRTWQYYIYLLVIIRLLVPFYTDFNLVGQIFAKVGEWAPSMQGSNRNTTEILHPEQEDIRKTEGMESGTTNSPVTVPDNRIGIEGSGESNGRTSFGSDVLVPEIDQSNLQDTVIDISHGELSGTDVSADMKHPAQKILLLAWVLPFLFLFIRKIMAYHCFLRQVKLGCRKVKEEKILGIYRDVCTELSIKRPPQLLQNSELSTPMLAGIFRPFVVLLDSDAAHIKEEQLRHILSHELIHWKRRDIYYKWLVQFAVCVHWFNPLVYKIRREVDRLCELSCDESLLKGLEEEERIRYGDTLLSAIRPSESNPNIVMLLSWNNNKKLIKERLDAIMKFHVISKMGKIVTALLTVVLLSAGAVTGAYASESGRTANWKDSFADSIAGEFFAEKIAQNTKKVSKHGRNRVIPLKLDVYKKIIDRAEEEPAVAEESYLFRVTETGKKILLYVDVGGEGRRTVELISPDGLKVRSYTFCESGFLEGSEEYVQGGTKIGKLMVTDVVEPGLWQLKVFTEENETGKFILKAKLIEPEVVSFVTDKSDPSSEEKEISSEKETKPNDISKYAQRYDYYRTYEEAYSDIKNGYLFYMDQSFSEKMMPLVHNNKTTSFQVHHDNILDIAIHFENLHKAEKKGIWRPITEKAFIRFELFNPEGELAFSFYKEEDDLEEPVDLYTEIPVYPGEWSYRISFAYTTDGQNTSNLMITAKYKELYQNDIEWLLENKL